MNDPAYLLVHRDHLFDPFGINSGAEMATLFLARTLSGRGKKVVLCGQLSCGDCERDGITYWDLGADFDLNRVFAKARELGSYHLLSAGRALPLVMSQNESACISRSLISHDRAGGDTGLDPKIVSRIADYIFCVSEAQKEVFVRDGANPSNAIVIHNGVDLDLFQAGETQKRNFKKIIFVGALVVDKGLHILLQSYSKLKNKYPDLSLDVYGSSELWRRDEYLKPQEIEQQLRGVKFHGKVEQTVIAKAMQTAGLCVVPSIWFDPFPLVSIDAQATGCPVIVSDVGGLKEGVIEGETGKVIKDIAESVLTETLDKLLSNPKELARMSEQALKLSRPRFTWQRLVDTVTTHCEQAAKVRTEITTETKDILPQGAKIGVFSTWNQECGLATYAGYLLKEFPQDSYVVLAEDTLDKKTAEDQDFVVRCWKKEGTDTRRIEQVIAEKNIRVVVFNFHTHYRFFAQPDFTKFLQNIRANGVKVVMHLHNTYSIDAKLTPFLKEADRVVVFSPENRLEAIANGASAQNTVAIPHGIHNSSATRQDKKDLRARLGMPENKKILVCFGFVQPHKGMEGMLESLIHLKKIGIAARGYITGSTPKGDANSEQYLRDLKSLAVQHGVAEDLVFLDKFLSEEDVSDYLAASDLVLMNYKSQHYEASGACSLALGAGAVVATSIAPPFIPYHDAVWHISSGFPAALSSELLLRDDSLRSEIAAKAKKYCADNNWAAISKLFFRIFSQLNITQPAKIKESAVTANNQSILKVLMQNRSTTFTHRGGDTIVMEKIKEGLERRNVSVTIDLEGKCDPKDFDLIHLFNFVLPDLIKYFGERAMQSKVPFVVTTLYEDVANFHNQSILLARQLFEYVRHGQNRAWFESSRINFDQVEKCKNFDNSWAVKNAAALFPNGEKEAATLSQDYPAISNLQVVPVGYDIGAEGNAEDFYKEHGVKDFIFCVGRLESRKNQLMLLKALEDIDLPIVIAGGGFSYQPEYEEAVRNFKRKGKTIILGRLSAHMLASAYRAARVHVLPSWYELPGLVSLEAAYYGCNVVVTDRGTARDYFGDKAFYCEPSSEASILEAVLTAYYSPLKAGLQEVAMKHTWENVADKTLEAYQTIVSGNASPGMQEGDTVLQVYDLDSGVTDFQDVLERGELAAKDRDFPSANRLLAEAERLNPNSVRMLRARGAVCLADGQVEAAKSYFERGIKLDVTNARLYSGLGMCEMQSGNPAKAYGHLIKSLEIAPHELVAILQLVECSYMLNSYEDLERILRRYLIDHADDMEMQYCLAGCIFKRGQLDESESMVDSILTKRPDHLGSKQLKSAIQDKRKAAPPVLPAQAQIHTTAIATPVSLASAITVETSSPASAAPREFDSMDARISEIEEMKRMQEYTEVRSACEQMRTNPLLRNDQKEKVEVLLAEVDVLDGEVVKADARYNEILLSNPNCARAMCGKGAITASRGDWNSARDYFESAKKLSPDFDVPYAGLGLYNYFTGDYEKAWECFMRAIDINPENVRALLGLIELGYPLKRLNYVEKAIKTYLDMHPVDLNFVYSLAGCYFAQDKLQEAISELDKIRLFEPQHKHAIELREIIDEKLGTSSASIGQ